MKDRTADSGAMRLDAGASVSRGIRPQPVRREAADTLETAAPDVVRELPSSASRAIAAERTAPPSVGADLDEPSDEGLLLEDLALETAETSRRLARLERLVGALAEDSRSSVATVRAIAGDLSRTAERSDRSRDEALARLDAREREIQGVLAAKSEEIRSLRDALANAHAAAASVAAREESATRSLGLLARWRAEAMGLGPELRLLEASAFGWFLHILLPRKLLQRIVWRQARRFFRRSGLFDAKYYVTTYPDVGAAGVDPLDHFVRCGVWEGRNPHPMFDTGFYLRSNPDVASAGMNPLMHFAKYGAVEGRRPHPAFSVHDLLAACASRVPGVPAERNAADIALPAMPPPVPFPLAVPAPARPDPASALSGPPGPSPASVVPAADVRPLVPKLRFEPVAIGPADGHRWSVAARARPAVAVVSHVMPFPPRAGNEYRIHRELLWLEAAGFDVYPIICPLPGDVFDDASVERAAREYRNLIVCEREGRLRYKVASRRLAERLARLGTDGVPTAADGAAWARIDEILAADGHLANIERTFAPDHLLHVLSTVTDAVRIGAVITNYVFMSRCLLALDDEIWKVVDTHDVFSTKHDKVVRFGIEDSLGVTKEQETAMLRRADIVVAIQPDEELELRELAPDRIVLTAGVDFDVVRHARPVVAEPIVSLVASKNPMNVRGLEDLLAFGWPRIRAQVPEARLRLVGPICDVFDGAADGVEVLGRVDDLAEIYASTRVVINPAVAGTGVKIKTLEALANLRPLVCWPSGADGIAPEARTRCHVAENWFDFSEKVVRLLRDDVAAGALVTSCAEIEGILSAERVYGELGSQLRAGIRASRAGGKVRG